MAKNMQPVLKRCRALGVSPAAMGYSKTSNKNPGGQRRAKKSEYATQLTEKQKVKFVYGIQEKQFHNYYDKATRAEGNTGEVLLTFVERPSGQRRVPSGLRQLPPSGPSAGEPWPLYRQRQPGEHPQLPGQDRATWSPCARRAFPTTSSRS